VRQVESEYFSALDANFGRLDYSERPELQKGTIDFDVSQSTDYWASNPPQHLSLADTLSDPNFSDVARKPQMMRYVFALDISHTSVHSGFLTSACVALRAIFFGRPAEDGSEAMLACLPPGCSIALVTFDDALHLYDLSVCSVQVWWYFTANSPPQPSHVTPRQFVIPDVDEPFLPLPPSALFVDPHQSRCAHFSHTLK
jgi:protein transport protein SEC24